MPKGLQLVARSSSLTQSLTGLVFSWLVTGKMIISFYYHLYNNNNQTFQMVRVTLASTTDEQGLLQQEAVHISTSVFSLLDF